MKWIIKEMCNDHNTYFSNLYIFQLAWRKPFIFQTLTIWPNLTQSLKYQKSTIFSCSDIRFKSLGFVIIAQLLMRDNNLYIFCFVYFLYSHESESHCIRLFSLLHKKELLQNWSQKLYPAKILRFIRACRETILMGK